MGVCTFFISIYVEFTMPEVVYKDKYLGMGSSRRQVSCRTFYTTYYA